jgi:hypothetical protein
MPNQNEVERKIDDLSQFAISEYGIDSRTINLLARLTKEINNEACKIGYRETDVFMSEGGIFVLVSYYSDDKSLEITILNNNKYVVFIESEHKKIEYKSKLTIWDVKSRLRFWKTTWDSSAYSRATPMTESSIDTMPQPFIEKTVGAESQYLIRTVYTPAD